MSRLSIEVLNEGLGFDLAMPCDETYMSQRSLYDPRCHSRADCKGIEDHRAMQSIGDTGVHSETANK